MEPEFSQEQLAEAAGMSRDAIARLELGGRWPRLDTLLQLAEALTVSLDDLAAAGQTVGSGPERLARLAADLDESDLQLLLGIAGLMRRRTR